MRKNRICHNVIEHSFPQRNGKPGDSSRIEMKVITVIKDPVSIWIVPAAPLNCIARDIDTPIVAFPDAPAAEQRSPVAAKVEHLGIFPRWMIELDIEISQ